jgi:predicted kinase
MTSLLLIRGLSGSGKSTLAKDMAEKFGYFHVEADMFFMKDGEYKFDRSQLGQAHDWCHKQAALALEQGKNVVVSNTFTQKWEIMPYCKMAKALGASFTVLPMYGNFENKHGVPSEAIERMRKRWEQW